MTDHKHDGGPAFPGFDAPVHGAYPHPVGGMSLRDYVAIEAMAPLMVAAFEGRLAYVDDETIGQTVARNAYSLADAMLAERAKK